MAQCSALLALLEAKADPTQRVYDDAVEDVIRHPHQISGLVKDDARDDLLILLTTRSHRLSRFFLRLRPLTRQMAKSSTASKLAIELVDMLVELLPHLHQLVENTNVLEFLVPALDVCFMPTQRPALHKLASVLAKSGMLLEHLASDHLGIEVVRQWASMQSTIALDAESLKLWTEKLVNMVNDCAIDHDCALETQQWHMLQTVKDSLGNIERSTAKAPGKQYPPSTPRDLPALGSMKQLNREEKKSRSTDHQDRTNAIPSLQDDDKHYLEAFDLQVPSSKTSLLDVIKSLEGEKTAAILLSIASRLPCYLCVSSLESASQTSKRETHDDRIHPLSIPQMKILDKGIGVWKVLLSPQALRSLLHLGSQRKDGSITEKLKGIASGSWDPKKQKFAGSKQQQKSLKVPVAMTKCGQSKFILWQIAIGVEADMEVPQQEITVWEVCDYDEISNIVDRVVFLQQTYSDETIARCKRSSAVDGMQIPARFENNTSHLVGVTRPSADLDVRTVDQNIIEMTNKYYALTEPVIHSILAKNLSAQFPFHLSKEEANVIRHFQTASLILGRSGTGKTTCLVFKLVGKYLASRAVADEKTVRQVLLTRSAFLADKLSAYTRQLIKTLLSESVGPDSSLPSDHTLPVTAEEDVEHGTVFTLRDTSFPLVCAWESFLKILENTAARYDSRRLEDLEEPADERTDERKNTRHSIYGRVIDFEAFKSDYWPRFSHALTKDLPVDLVFAEIMGVIKGSASSRESLEPLCREEYLKRSCRLAPTFVTETERSRVHDVFKNYEKLKLERGAVDYVDRTVKLIRAIRRDRSLNKLLRFTFHEVYIDEIQDQRQLDIELLLSFVRDGRGFHCAGDTAQAISQESTFRFSDIKALFHEHFAAASAATHQAELSRPQMFTLSENYRSHEGILAIASLVMRMIWKGFPETVDKLDPEIGHLNGPKPVLFRGVESQIFQTRNVGHATLSAGTADFGAEQVILVRDMSMKRSLQDQIGGVALVLTILESKGMEFDDVILWNFFTDCPDQAGVRSLEELVKEPAMFDPRKHGGMCSELKSLYVAITRAKFQLFIMESSQRTATAVLNFLSNENSGSLVDVTSPSHEDFGMRLEMLRPGTSLNPRQWSQRGDEFMRRAMYLDAINCFQKAQDVRGETIAEGHRLEHAARHCMSEKDTEGFTNNLNLAKQCFLKEHLVDDAARVLVALGKPEDAAEILLEDGKYSKAARMFADAGLSTKAIECHHRAREYRAAAVIMNKNQDYDQLVSYLDENRENIPTTILQSYNPLCKLLLKQNKTSTGCRKHAIRLLGSSAEQEKCFLEYGMDEELVELYAGQLRYIDLLHLYTRKGQLEQALSLLITKNLLQSAENNLEIEVLNLLNYAWVGHSQKLQQSHYSAPFKLPSGYLTPKVILRVEQWEAYSFTYGFEGSIARQQFLNMKDPIPKSILSLRKILNATTVTGATKLDDLPIEMIQEVIKIARDLVSNKDGNALGIVLLLAGVWRPAKGKGHLIVLPWSPIRGFLVGVSNTDLTKIVIQRVLESLASAILELDTKARSLWTEKWPIRCAQYISKGFCSKKRNGEQCLKLHQSVTTDDCASLLDDLLTMNSIFCDLAVFYHRRSLNTKFLEKYLGIRRHWLERLLRELVYLSSVEQNTATITRARKELFRNKNFITVSFLEQLLYYRLGNEWQQRSDFTSLLEQMQLAKLFGSNVQNRLFRALSHRLFLDQRDLMQGHLRLLNSLKENVGYCDAGCFQDRLTTFLLNLDNIEVSALSTLHALTAVIEYLAGHLILKTSTTACVIPNSWIDLYVSTATHSHAPSEGDDKYIYQRCLIQLAKSFCHILSRLGKATVATDSFVCSGHAHPSLLLRQRNAELVAVIRGNLAAISPEPPIGFNEILTRAKEVFEYDLIKAFHLRSSTTDELTRRLAISFEKYNGKDALVVMIRDRIRGSPFYSLQHLPAVRTIQFDELFPPVPIPGAVGTSVGATSRSSPVVGADSTDDQYSTEETEAMIKIQRLWRFVSAKIKTRRFYVSVPLCRVTARFFNLGAQCSDTVSSGDRKAVRKLLLSQGVALSLRLDTTSGLQTKLQKDAMSCLENVEISQGVDESVDDILGRVREVESSLEKSEEMMSDDNLLGLVKQGFLSVLEKALKDVEEVMVKVEQNMFETRKMIDSVSRSGT